MGDDQKYEMYYKLWEYHSSLMWGRVQHILAVFAGIFAAWFLLIKEMLIDSPIDYMYLIILLLLSAFGVVLCFYLKKLVARDADHQHYYEEKLDIFGDLKSPNVGIKKRGRWILVRILNICLVACILLFIIAFIMYILKML